MKRRKQQVTMFGCEATLHSGRAKGKPCGRPTKGKTNRCGLHQPK